MKTNFQTCPSLFLFIKEVLLKLLIKNDVDILEESGFLKSASNRLPLESKDIFLEQNEEYLDYIENEEEYIIDRILNI